MSLLRKGGLEGQHLVSFSPGKEALSDDQTVFQVSILQLVSHSGALKGMAATRTFF